MEIGSFIELQMPPTQAYHAESRYPNMQVAGFNSGRTAIWYAFCLTGCDAVWLPYYQCETVRDYLSKKGVRIRYYHIDRYFTPTDLCPKANEAVLLVNYYGIMSEGRMRSLSALYSHVIIDNCQAFFALPIENCQNVYSCRKFIGVPDGAYVIGENARANLSGIEQGYSSDTSLFLLQRIEYGCEGKTYASREQNENRIDHEDIRLMSNLTKYILHATDYAGICRKRKENFQTTHSLFSSSNRIDPLMHFDYDCVPMIYPLLIEDDDVLPLLLKHKHFQGHWWKYITQELEPNCFEYYLSRYMIPITIDQRYSTEDIEGLYTILKQAGYVSE